MHGPGAFHISSFWAWPAAGMTIAVLMAISHAVDRRRRLAAIEKELRRMFVTVADQPVPARFELVVDTLEEQSTQATPTVEPAPRASSGMARTR